MKEIFNAKEELRELNFEKRKLENKIAFVRSNLKNQKFYWVTDSGLILGKDVYGEITSFSDEKQAQKFTSNEVLDCDFDFTKLTEYETLEDTKQF